MAHVIVSDPARRDLIDIISFLSRNAGIAVARRYSAKFSGALKRLATMPASGSPRAALGPDARVLSIHPYIVVYDYAAEHVVVLRIIHTRRNVTRDLVRG
jgi:toxin ParE1/3/4